MKVRVQDRQSFFDVAIRHTGDAAAAYDIALAAGCSVTDQPPSEVEIPAVINSIVATYFDAEQPTPATMINDEDLAKLQ